MEKILDLISGKMADAFESAGFDRSYGRICANTSAMALWQLPRSITRPPFRLPRP